MIVRSILGGVTPLLRRGLIIPLSRKELREVDVRRRIEGRSGDGLLEPPLCPGDVAVCPADEALQCHPSFTNGSGNDPWIITVPVDHIEVLPRRFGLHL